MTVLQNGPTTIYKTMVDGRTWTWRRRKEKERKGKERKRTWQWVNSAYACAAYRGARLQMRTANDERRGRRMKDEGRELIGDSGCVWKGKSIHIQYIIVTYR